MKSVYVFDCVSSTYHTSAAWNHAKRFSYGKAYTSSGISVFAIIIIVIIILSFISAAAFVLLYQERKWESAQRCDTGRQVESLMMIRTLKFYSESGCRN